MKFFVTIAIFALIAAVFADQPGLTEEQKAKVKEYGEQCKKEITISEEEVTKLRNKDFSSPTDAQKCFIRCFFEKTDAYKDDVVQDDVVLQKLGAIIGEQKTKELMAKCNGLKGADNCDTAFKIFECYENGKSVTIV